MERYKKYIQTSGHISNRLDIISNNIKSLSKQPIRSRVIFGLINEIMYRDEEQEELEIIAKQMGYPKVKYQTDLLKYNPETGKPDVKIVVLSIYFNRKYYHPRVLFCEGKLVNIDMYKDLFKFNGIETENEVPYLLLNYINEKRERRPYLIATSYYDNGNKYRSNQPEFISITMKDFLFNALDKAIRERKNTQVKKPQNQESREMKKHNKTLNDTSSYLYAPLMVRFKTRKTKMPDIRQNVIRKLLLELIEPKSDKEKRAAKNDSGAAETILQQLGGNKFIAMTGATVMKDDNGNTLRVKFKGSPKANIMWVTLNSMDLYDITIAKYRGDNVKVVAKLENAYSDMLVDFFERTTGLRTSLSPR